MRDDAFADECTEYAKEKLLQRDVEIIVESVDKNGTFMGTLFLRKEVRNNQCTVLITISDKINFPRISLLLCWSKVLPAYLVQLQSAQSLVLPF